jgi:MoaA/NifB/PqqE/SkfB family radical SAM enzyme
MPGVIGNIYKQSFEEIWNGQRIQAYRRRCLKGVLHCRRGCGLAPRHYNLETKPKIYVPAENLKRIWFLFGERCNIRCIMCPQRGQDMSIPVLDFERIKDKISSKNLTSVIIQGGEPLYMSAAIAAFKYYGGKGCDVSFLTNGTIMNSDIATMVVDYSSKFQVSLNAATKETHEKVNKGSLFEKVLANIAAVRKKADELGKPIEIILHMTIVPENIHEVPLFIQKAKSFGADSLDFGHDASVRKFLVKHPVLFKQLQEAIEQAFKDMRGEYRVTDIRHFKSLGFVFGDETLMCANGADSLGSKDQSYKSRGLRA